MNIKDSRYVHLLNTLKSKIRISRQKAVLSANKEMLLLYWEIGAAILENQKKSGWGLKIVDNLSKDLKKAFPDQKGFSSRNLKYMRKFAQEYPDFEFVQEVLAQITWYHNITIMEKIKPIEERHWYIQETVNNGWSRNVLVHHIERGTFNRQGKAITNFRKNLPPPQSDLARQALKDPYIFDFLSMEEPSRERELENALIQHLKKLLNRTRNRFCFCRPAIPFGNRRQGFLYRFIVLPSQTEMLCCHRTENDRIHT